MNYLIVNFVRSINNIIKTKINIPGYENIETLPGHEIHARVHKYLKPKVINGAHAYQMTIYYPNAS